LAKCVGCGEPYVRIWVLEAFQKKGHSRKRLVAKTSERHDGIPTVGLSGIPNTVCQRGQNVGIAFEVNQCLRCPPHSGLLFIGQALDNKRQGGAGVRVKTLHVHCRTASDLWILVRQRRHERRQRVGSDIGQAARCELPASMSSRVRHQSAKLWDGACCAWTERLESSPSSKRTSVWSVTPLQ